MNKILFLSKYITKESLRNKAELFFNLFFPLIFLVMFGFVFNNESDNMLSIALYADHDVRYYTENLSQEYKVYELKTINKIKENIKNGNYDVGIIIKNGEIILYYDNTNINNTAFMNAIELKLKKLVMNKDYKLDYLVTKEFNISPTNIKGKYIDFLLTGVIAISLLSNGMFSVITVFGRYKKLNILKRFILLPIRPYVFVIGITLTRIIISFLSLILLSLLGKLIFSSIIQINWILYILLGITSTLGMMGFGLLFLFLFKKSETAQNAASIFFSIMLFFSGVYFPVEFLPKSLRYFSYFLPIKYIVDALRYITGIDVMNVSTFVILNIVMLLDGISLLIVASRSFLTPEN
ncbi:ABC-2 type transport system permease protein [Marinitoga hydrogenitolerans DSM 16785]|uniref:Transport permease protein n=1 Tax=Marinitoga hydrogenitolerans (strain DSM 16785 / JCM 12826 / AT1271) TaxID=1122195 RepID=A0A1M4WCT3_MARH1|nr:ABC transporter permease [Marinitoga hydrogenitolerans]SHE78997.1 ABC-2 type transport system permease protein [Marinitoga hydrogenitolerans DSM 16785]